MEDAVSSIQGVQGGSASAMAALAAQKTQAVKQESPQQEALETAAVTKAEAGKGDQQAVRKLARAQTPPKVEATEVRQAKGGIDLTA